MAFIHKNVHKVSAAYNSKTTDKMHKTVTDISQTKRQPTENF